MSDELYKKCVKELREDGVLHLDTMMEVEAAGMVVENVIESILEDEV